jgi:hypothetical protein
MDYTILLMVVAWLVSGAASHIYWWTKHFDFTTDDIYVCFFSSLVGPISFLIGWRTFNKFFPQSPPAIIFPKRTSSITR